MNYNDAGMVSLAYWGSIVTGLILLFVAWKWQRLARLLFVLLFGYAALINYNLSHDSPEVYLDYATFSVRPYSDFLRVGLAGTSLRL